MSTEAAIVRGLVERCEKISNGVQRFYNEDGWDASRPNFHRFNRSSPLVQQLSVLNFLDYLIGDCGITKVFGRVHPAHCPWFFSTASEGFRALDLEEEGNAAVAIAAWVGQNPQIVADFFASYERYYDHSEEDEEAHARLVEVVERALNPFAEQLEPSMAVNVNLSRYIDDHWEQLGAELDFPRQ